MLRRGRVVRFQGLFGGAGILEDMVPPASCVICTRHGFGAARYDAIAALLALKLRVRCVSVSGWVRSSGSSKCAGSLSLFR